MASERPCTPSCRCSPRGPGWCICHPQRETSHECTERFTPHVVICDSGRRERGSAWNEKRTKQLSTVTQPQHSSRARAVQTHVGLHVANARFSPDWHSALQAMGVGFLPSMLNILSHLVYRRHARDRYCAGARIQRKLAASSLTPRTGTSHDISRCPRPRRVRLVRGGSGELSARTVFANRSRRQRAGEQPTLGTPRCRLWSVTDVEALRPCVCMGPWPMRLRGTPDRLDQSRSS